MTEKYVNSVPWRYPITFVDGKREEDAVVESSYGCIEEGRYEHGLKKGIWVVHSCSYAPDEVYEIVYDDDGNLEEHE